MKFIFFASIFISVSSQAQKIKVSEIDKFTKKRRIETSYVPVKSGLLQSASAMYRSVDTACFFTLAGSWAVGTVGPNDQLVFLLDNDSSIIIYPTDIQSYEIGRGSFPGSYTHQYYISPAQIQQFIGRKVVSVRRYYNSNYADADLTAKAQEGLPKLSEIFLNELNKHKL